LTLDEANQRWAGAHCRSRQGLTLRKGKNKEGWTKTAWLFWDEDGGNQRARVWFTEAEALRRTLGNNFIPVGSEFIARGWRIDDSGNSLILELELAGTSSRVKVYFWDSWVGRVGLPRLHDFEQWARFDLFELTSVPSEQLVDVAGPTAEPRPTQSPQSELLPPTAMEIDLLAASAEPSRVTPGEEIQLVAIYAVQGVPPGQQVTVVEKRFILHAGKVVTTLEASAHREPGTHRSSQSLRLPGDVKAGIYELRLSLEADGAGAQGSTIFEVLDYESQ
jgi:hypothetical protein